MANDLELLVKIGLDAANFTAAISTVEKQVKQFGKSAKQAGDSLQVFDPKSTGITSTTAAIQPLVATMAEVGAAATTAGTAMRAGFGVMSSAAFSSASKVTLAFQPVGGTLTRIGAEAVVAGKLIGDSFTSGAIRAAAAFEIVRAKIGGAAFVPIAAAGKSIGDSVSAGVIRASGALDTFKTKISSTFASFSAGAKSVSESTKKMADGIKGFGTFAAGVGATVALPMGLAVNSAYEVQGALGKVASLGVKDLKSLKDEAINFSNTWTGTTAASFIDSTYDIKSAINSLSDQDLPKFTSVVALTAKATKADVGLMAKTFGAMYDVFRNNYSSMSDQQFGEMISGGIAKAVQTFRTDGAQLADAVRLLGQVASGANVPLAEQLSILGQLQASMPGAEAATLYKSFLMNVGKAGEKLGLQFSDANDHMKSTPEIIELIKRKFGDLSKVSTQMKLKEAFGSDEAFKYVLAMAGKTDQLKKNIVGMGDALRTGTTLTRQMAESMNGNKLELTFQNFKNVLIRIGEIIITNITPYLEVMLVRLRELDAWIQKHQTAVMWITSIGSAIVVLGAACAGIAAVLWPIMIVFSTIAGWFAAGAVFGSGGAVASLFVWIGGALGTLGTGIMALIGGIITAVGWPVIAVVAAVTAIIGLIWYFWEDVKIFFDALWTGFKKIYNWIVNGVAAGMLWVYNAITNVFRSGGRFLWSWLSEAWNMVYNWVRNLVNWMQSGFTKFFNWLHEKIVSAFQALTNLTEKSNGTAQLGDRTNQLVQSGKVSVPAYASGGIALTPQVAVIGEKKPEAVLPLDLLKGLGGSGATINVYQQRGEDSKALATRLARMLRGRE